MQKIMFNDKYGLTDLVLSGQKTQTRRVVKEQYRYPNKEVYWDANHKALCFRGKTTVDYIATPRYYVGEVVAVAQSYQKAGVVFVPIRESDFINKRSVKWGNARKLAGWKPDWKNNENKFTIEIIDGEITTYWDNRRSRILSFQSIEVRDKFLENFRELIEKAKELI